MSKKKSYMNQSNLINEGFFNKISKFLRNRPKVGGKKKLGFLKSIKLALSVAGINRAVGELDKNSEMTIRIYQNLQQMIS